MEKETSKKQFKLGRIITNSLLVVPLVFNFLDNLMQLVKLEASIAGRNIVIILMLAIVAACLLTSTWICVLIILFYLLIAHLSLIQTMLVIIAFNLLLLLILSLTVSRLQKTILFPKTRKQLCTHNEE